MAKASVKFVPVGSMIDFYISCDVSENAKKLIAANAYAQGPVLEIDAREGSDAAEEVFDLSNNPSRDEERFEKYGRCRSVSVGDIVEVDGVSYLCASVGWVKM